MTVPFFPAGLTTGIGSFPFSKPEDAWEIITRFLDIPIWPQLPKRDFREQMNYQFLEGFPCVVCDMAEGKMWVHLGKDEYDRVGTFYQKYLLDDLETFRVSREFALGLHFFVEKMEREERRHSCLKGHITGPLTLGLGITDQNGKAIYYDEEMRDVVVRGLARKAAWQIGLLRRIADRVILFVDEPVMAGFGTSAFLGLLDADVIRILKEMVEEIHRHGALAGIHCCGNTDWGIVLKSGVDVASFDAYNYAVSISLYPEEVKNLFDREGILAWGIVPNSEEVKGEKVETLFERLMEGFRFLEEAGFEEEELWWRCLLTPSCGTGSMAEEDVEPVFSLLKGVGEKFRGEFEKKFVKAS